ncbi:copper resistance protein CopC [Gracilibacillus sp. S3-1-1]|uniref:Copper resistance protein CopC n=1 Tax=Gracilibacillus pellucidus TaxID=3095368 RepID=A0ACC6M775_9BACI|nr:copper resistance protein CopC [Gracilibacillus sp. S3-1-1]MDX8046840.1 copper resistance protein CopC [Gracilibacillus sp. S3-1-1]
MFKRALLLIIVLLIALPTAISAHTHLETSNPEENSVLDENTEAITLTFDSTVQDVNEVTLTGENDEVLQPDFSHDSADTIIVTLPEEMEDGAYTLFFSIVSEDGHVMEQELAYQFLVSEEATPEEATDEQEVTEDPIEEEADQVESDANEVVEDTEESNNSTMIIVIAIILVIVAILAVVMMRKNKK